MVLSLIMYIVKLPTLNDNEVELSINAFHSLVVAPWLISGYYRIYRQLQEVNKRTTEAFKLSEESENTQAKTEKQTKILFLFIVQYIGLMCFYIIARGLVTSMMSKGGNPWLDRAIDCLTLISHLSSILMVFGISQSMRKAS